MLKKFLLVIILSQTLTSACNNRRIKSIQIFNDEKIHIADSIFINGKLKCIKFIDSTYFIDSIVYKRFENDKLSSIETFYKGSPIFENINYYKNGNIYRYKFYSSTCKDCFYERFYDIKGKFTEKIGNPFFNSSIMNYSGSVISVLKGDTINYRIFFPNPPDCFVDVLLVGKDNKLYDVFNNTFLKFLKTTYSDNNFSGNYETRIKLIIKESNDIDISEYTNSFFIKVQ